MWPGNRMGDHCCWICGDAVHLSYQCPDNCCWICGDRDHWSNRCPRHVKPYNSLVEAMIDLKFKNLHGEDLMSAYLDDIAAVEQRVDTVNEVGCSILQERLRLLRRKAEELAKCLQQPAPTPLQAFEEQGPFPLGTFPPGSYPAQQQRLYENLPKQLKDAYRKEANRYGPMSSDEKNAYDTLAEIFSQMEATNSWIEMCMESRPCKKRTRDLFAFRVQLADQMKEWEDFAKEPVKVLGSVS